MAGRLGKGLEWSRTWVLGGFPWLPLSASQWERPSILQIAAFTGAYGVSFVLVAFNIGFAAYGHRLFREGERGLRKRSQEFFLALFLLLACLCIHIRENYDRFRTTIPLARVAFVQPDIPQEVKWDQSKADQIAKVLQDTTFAAIKTRPDLILWPESTTPWAVKGDLSMKNFVESLSKRAKAPMLIGSNAVDELGGVTEWHNSAFVVDPDIGVQSSYYSKRKLVPFGEYIPFRPLFGWLSKVVPIGGDFIPGKDPSPLMVKLPRGTSGFGMLICYEDIYPQLALEDVRSGADMLAVISNGAWFGEGGAAYQHAAHSVLRAIETRRPVLRDGNAGWSGWINEFGGFKAVENHDGTVYFRGAEAIEVNVDTRWVGRQSFYVQHGDWFVAVCAGLALFGGALLKVGGIVPVETPEEGPGLREIR